MLSVNTNYSAMIALQNLNFTNTELEGVQNKISTGLKIGSARDNGAITVDLTSRPSRESANRLYKRMGFEQRDTNVYRFTL